MRGTVLTKVPTEMASASKDGVLVSADGVYDYILKQFLEDINKFLLETKADIDDLGDLVLLDFLTPSDVGALPEETKYAGADVLGGPAISANKINTNAGSNIRPVYFENGVPVQINHTIEKDVPQNAKFTDTLNTTGATNTSDKIYLIGAKTLDENPQTYTLDTAYVGPDGCLYSGGEKVITDTSNKADKVSGATENNFVAFDENGNLKDSNKSANSFANASHEHTVSEITDFPNLGSAAYENSGNFVTEVAYDSQLKKITRTKNNVTSEVLSLNTLKLDLELGQPNGVATLDESGKVPSTQLPAYVDDVIELNDITDTAPVECAKDDIYYNTSTKKLYIATAVNTWSNEGKTPESGKIYTNLSNDKTYRWGGTTMVIISETLAIGTTLGTAADGKVVYDHINNINNPHRVTAAQLGLENVGNFKAVSTVVNQGLTDEEQTNARNNINAESETRASSHYTNYNNPHLVTKVQVGLENVTNDVQVKRTEMGEPNGVATLDSNGKIPSLLIPNNVRDIKLLKTIKISNNTNVAAAIEGEYYYDSLTKKLYVTIKTVSDEEPPITSYSWLEISPESDKIYINTENNKPYRWNGTDMVDIGLIIGTSQETAASGKIVDDHIKNKLNPHEVTATQIGLGHVDDKSSATLKSEIMTAANVKEVLETTNGTEKFFREDGTWLIPNYPDVSDFATKEEAGIEIDNIHQYVDLGLPSGTLWATMNVGANSITDYGNYYQYGKGAAQYSATSGQSNYSGTENPLASNADTATQVWGNSWHTPTKAQCDELIANTNIIWTIIDGINGFKCVAKDESSKYVFLPIPYYSDIMAYGSNMMTSTPALNSSVYAIEVHYLEEMGIESFIVTDISRSSSFFVRPVCDSVPVKSTKADKVVNATTGNLAGLNSEGNLIDSGISAFSINLHIGDTNNPHAVTAAQVGLENVVNTGDSDIPVAEGTTKFTTGGAYIELNKKIDKIINKTYAEMIALRNNSGFAPGLFYRITNYVTTTMLENTNSVEHPFDIIVQADDVNKLNENAHVALHSGDVYFSNSKLEVWEIKYTLDNINWSKRALTSITSKYENFTFIKEGTTVLDGETVILWRGDSNYIDEYGFTYAISRDENINSKLYVGDEDFEEGIFPTNNFDDIGSKITGSTEGYGTIYWMRDEFNNECPYDFKNILFKRWNTTNLLSGRVGFNGEYLISDLNNIPNNLTCLDETDCIWAFTFSSDVSGGTQTDTSLLGSVYNNIFHGCDDKLLPNNVIYGLNNYNNTFGYNCYNNSISNKCLNNIIGNNFYNNSIESNFKENIIGNFFNSNSIGNLFYSNFVGNAFEENTLDVEISDNIIGNDCYSNIIKKLAEYNTIGNHFYSNVIESNFKRNYIGNFCSNIQILKNHVLNIIIENENLYINITSTETTSSNAVLRNFTISLGVNNSTTVKIISHNSVNDIIQTKYQPTNSKIISV